MKFFVITFSILFQSVVAAEMRSLAKKEAMLSCHLVKILVNSNKNIEYIKTSQNYLFSMTEDWITNQDVVGQNDLFKIFKGDEGVVYRKSDSKDIEIPYTKFMADGELFRHGRTVVGAIIQGSNRPFAAHDGYGFRLSGQGDSTRGIRCKIISIQEALVEISRNRL